MTTETTKAGKECPNCSGAGEVEEYADSPHSGVIECDMCHGLGWLPQPGDALTKKEADLLCRTHLIQLKCVGGTVGLINSMLKSPEWTFWNTDMVKPSELVGGTYYFRVAPAQEQPKECPTCSGDGYTFADGICIDCEATGKIQPVREDQPAEKVESRWEAQQRCFKQKSRNTIVHDLDHSWGFHAAVDWLLSLTPAQLEALRQERSK